MKDKDFQAKNQGVDLSLALAKERLTSAGAKASVKLPSNNERLEPLRQAVRRTLAVRTPGVSRRLVRKLSGSSA
jgi:hypothetical protein